MSNIACLELSEATTLRCRKYRPSCAWRCRCGRMDNKLFCIFALDVPSLWKLHSSRRLFFFFCDVRFEIRGAFGVSQLCLPVQPPVEVSLGSTGKRPR